MTDTHQAVQPTVCKYVLQLWFQQQKSCPHIGEQLFVYEATVVWSVAINVQRQDLGLAFFKFQAW